MTMSIIKIGSSTIENNFQKWKQHDEFSKVPNFEIAVAKAWDFLVVLKFEKIKDLYAWWQRLAFSNRIPKYEFQI